MSATFHTDPESNVPTSKPKPRPGFTLIELLVIGEENAVPWMAPVDADEALVLSLGPSTRLHHPGGTNVGFVGGPVSFLRATPPEGIRRAMITISGNDEVAKEW